MLYLNIIEDKLEKEIKPKDNQDPAHLKFSFKWIAKAQLGGKIKETIWKLLHRKLYTPKQDGGKEAVFETSHAKDIWHINSIIWHEWTDIN